MSGIRRFAAPVVLVVFLLSLLVGCSGRDESALPDGAAMYYWRTTLALDSAEREFLRNHDVRRIYIRFFDVVKSGDEAVPNATVTVSSEFALPDSTDYVPVVFVTPDALSGDVAQMGERIVRRVIGIAETNDLPRPAEIQIDCDWTRTTRARFYELMENIRRAAAAEEMKLSATIRLHQLATEPPPADYGVLMVYNTGDLRTPEKGNPILSAEAVEPYLKYVADYELPLVAAYPNFRWPVVYAPAKEGRSEYIGILYGCRPDTMPDMFRRLKDGSWIAISSRRITSAVGNKENAILVTPGMRLEMFEAGYDVVSAVRKGLQRERPSLGKCVILYDLNESNLNIFTKQQYEEIFTR